MFLSNSSEVPKNKSEDRIEVETVKRKPKDGSNEQEVVTVKKVLL